MLRALFGALVLANLLFFGFSRGWFDGPLGVQSLGEREPERLAAQVRPESIRVLAPTSASAAVATSCYETAAYHSAEASDAEATLRNALPAGSWSEERSDGTAAGATRTFRIAAADASLAARLSTLKLDSLGRGFVPCASASSRR